MHSRLEIRTLTGAKFTLRMRKKQRSSLSVSDLKRAIADNIQVPVEGQVLAYKGKTLDEPSQLLSDSGIHDGDFIVVINHKSKARAKKVRKRSRPRLPPGLSSSHAAASNSASFSMEATSPLNSSRSPSPSPSSSPLVWAPSDDDEKRDLQKEINELRELRERRLRAAKEAANSASTQSTLSKSDVKHLYHPFSGQRRTGRGNCSATTSNMQTVRIPRADKNKIEKLKTMGFHQEASKKALQLNRNSVELALNWLLENNTSPDLNKPLTGEELLQHARSALADSQSLRESLLMDLNNEESSSSSRYGGPGLRRGLGVASILSTASSPAERLARLEEFIQSRNSNSADDVAATFR